MTSCSTSYKTDKSNVTDTEKTKETILDNSVKENILTEKNYDTDNYDYTKNFEILAAARNLLPEIYNEIVNIPKEVFTQYFKQIDPLYSTYIKHADLELVEEFIMSK